MNEYPQVPIPDNYAYDTMQNQNAPPSMYGGRQQDDVLTKLQLEVDSILERAEHLFRGDKLEVREEGGVRWVKAKTEDEKLLNEFGVSQLMEVMVMYVNRNTLLSNYDEETINAKMYDFGMEVADLIFLKYEKMGMDTLEKRKKYPMIVREMLDMVHSTYLRALHGGERKALISTISVTQSQTVPLQPMGGVPMMPQVEKKNPLNPRNWFGGKKYQ